MKPTTIKLTVETRERLRALGGETYEDTVVEALELLEAERFWGAAEAAARWRDGLSDHDRERRRSDDATIDRAFDALG